MNRKQLTARLHAAGLKATPRRLAILGAIISLDNHPTADEIIGFLKERKLNIGRATIYKALDSLLAKRIILRVETGNDIIRYDAVNEPHHHLFSTESGTIKDYRNEEISMILENYFRKNKIVGFEIDEIKLHLKGRFSNN